MYWNCKIQHDSSNSHGLVPCYVPACCTSTHAKCPLTDSRCSEWLHSNPLHCWNLSLGSWRILSFRLTVGGRLNKHVHFHVQSCMCLWVWSGVERQKFLFHGRHRGQIQHREKEKKKPVTWSIMQAAHLNPSLPGTSTLRARIQPTCEWAPGHLSRWAWKSAASRPCMCINGGCWGHDSQRRMS